MAPSNPVGGIGVAIGVAVVGAALWALIADTTKYRLSLIGVVIGIGVGVAFVRFGLGGMRYAIAAAVIAVAGCALGDIAAGTLVVAGHFGVSPATVIQRVPLTTLMNVDGLDAAFYAIAAFVAFRRVLPRR